MVLGAILEDEDINVQSQGESQGNIGLLFLLFQKLHFYFSFKLIYIFTNLQIMDYKFENVKTNRREGLNGASVGFVLRFFIYLSELDMFVIFKMYLAIVNICICWNMLFC